MQSKKSVFIVCFLMVAFSVIGQQPRKSNIILISIDDLNDWVGCLGGHPQAKTPNIDRLAKQGVLFTNAHCQSPVCNPSRVSIMTSLYPSTSGIYFLNPDLAESEVAKNNRLMPLRFQDEGYFVTGAGKLFHNANGVNEKYVPNYGGDFGGFGPYPKEKLTAFQGHKLWDWGVYPQNDEQMPDHEIANWAVKQLQKQYDTALWLGVGFFRPHVPQYAPKKWFDLHPIETLQLPVTIPNDLVDIPQYGIDITRKKHIAPMYQWVIENNEWKPLVQSYLACVSFVDAQIGRILDAIESGGYTNNTYIVLYSDHGFHLGEKERFAKRSIWEDSTKIPLIIAGPGIEPGQCSKPVELIDIYPTLLALIGLNPDSLHEGNSLVPLLKNHELNWPHYARTSFGPGNYAIVSEQYRYVKYNNGAEEFYNHEDDPHEWYNQINNSKYKEQIALHRQQIPEECHVVLGENSTGHKAYNAAETNKSNKK
ncbi:sulfatase [Seonamhaeicola aphaedonensis]|uniref:Arylsulfatase A-like enzyme n=1 Tax=Seonamhaeicola aphaedonensis TaxID=1461338 RepID=A0A3D9HEZ0_9FLAO|nr:sulfatase [Seonamhaeicola aphaedonensis]RED47811.1 arylsulfatase A-like enzyme [Seonamhaeicola aphaedonensis]